MWQRVWFWLWPCFVERRDVLWDMVLRPSSLWGCVPMGMLKSILMVWVPYVGVGKLQRRCLWFYFCSFFHGKCNILFQLTDKMCHCCFVYLLHSRWKLQLNVVLLTIVLQVYCFCAISIWQNRFAFFFNSQVLLPAMRSIKHVMFKETAFRGVVLLLPCSRVTT